MEMLIIIGPYRKSRCIQDRMKMMRDHQYHNNNCYNCFMQAQVSLCFIFLKALHSPSCCASWPSSSRTFRFRSLSL